MYYEKIKLSSLGLSGSSDYAAAYLYFLEESPEIPTGPRPTALILPGGGYAMTSDREAEAVAYRFLAKGINAVVLRYSVKPFEYPVQLLELARTVLLIKELGPSHGADKDQIFTVGFSAGAHLTGCFGNFWHEDLLSEALHCRKEDLRIQGQILGYPVITSGPYAHEGSFRNLLGDRFDDLKGFLSLEDSVSSLTPPTFIFATQTDSTVPIQNSLLMVDALVKAGVVCEFHMYPFGPHGLSLADPTVAPDPSMVLPHVAGWIDLAIEFVQLISKKPTAE